MEPKQLMKKGEREAATFIKLECCRSRGEGLLNEMLNYLLDPSKDVDEQYRLKWCKALIAGGVSFEEFAKTGACGIILTFRCRPNFSLFYLEQVLTLLS